MDKNQKYNDLLWMLLTISITFFMLKKRRNKRTSKKYQIIQEQ